MPTFKPCLKKDDYPQNDDVVIAGSSKRQCDSESSDFKSDPKKNRLHEYFEVEQNFIQNIDNMISVCVNLIRQKIKKQLKNTYYGWFRLLNTKEKDYNKKPKV
ncbi:hypothetical protein ACJJTC_017591 [Scirpophaga incertulas]